MVRHYASTDQYQNRSRTFLNLQSANYLSEWYWKFKFEYVCLFDQYIQNL